VVCRQLNQPTNMQSRLNCRLFSGFSGRTDWIVCLLCYFPDSRAGRVGLYVFSGFPGRTRWVVCFCLRRGPLCGLDFSCTAQIILGFQLYTTNFIRTPVVRHKFRISVVRFHEDSSCTPQIFIWISVVRHKFSLGFQLYATNFHLDFSCTPQKNH
jgi:hypothetical protein